MSTQELQRANGGAVAVPSQPTAMTVPDDFMPVFSVDQAVARRKAIVNFVPMYFVTGGTMATMRAVLLPIRAHTFMTAFTC
ncbi:MAG: hypothetical protein SGI92_30575 [Bryobacteraceae bacterium]|nr:hypothetical protein [Bryobacteraceae bacterium]